MLLGIKIEYYVVCFIGTIVLYSKLLTENQKVLRILIHFNRDWEGNTVVNIADAILFCLLGAFVGTWLCQPTNLAQSISAGLGWTGAINVTTSSYNKNGKGA
ncbi:MAG: hypothetical protein N3I35_05530 [Clostridia bacterium]|nr:hypothetical protein [Clostridia bacterium]